MCVPLAQRMDDGLRKVCFCCAVPGGGVQEGHTRGRPHATRAALPLRLPLLQQRHRAALSGPDASFHQDVPRISRWVMKNIWQGCIIQPGGMDQAEKNESLFFFPVSYPSHHLNLKKKNYSGYSFSNKATFTIDEMSINNKIAALACKMNVLFVNMK